MSQRYLIPTNLFYHWQDPWPPAFPEPNTGDIYLNVSSQIIRIFYEGEWHDATPPVTGFLPRSEFMVEPNPAPVEGPPGGTVGTVHIQY